MTMASIMMMILKLTLVTVEQKIVRGILLDRVQDGA